ncbi:glucokinase [Aquabacterium sp. A7-Y]|uniref:glucokinase n=1 Tax=Aquabacterium sp. A7-Y TaxID=1349605 RepID=UPI00223CBE0E|nr:glucokinase [Aquabacterium sp. A7-Y]MCW7540940.1 glucokinase [Aquabacterium sp. A7-Y]
MQSTRSYPRMVGDVGGTNARFAWLEAPDAPMSEVASYACAEYPTLQDAMAHYLRQHAKPSPRWCAIGIANPVVGDQVKMTNHHWSFSMSEVQRQLGMDRFLVINDFTALALSLPALAPAELRQVGGGRPVAKGPLGLVGPGTGLGVSGLLPAMAGHGAIPINGEGGHATLAPMDDREEAVIRVLRGRFGHVSAERVVSGLGLLNLYQAVCDLDGVEARPLTAADITTMAVAGGDAQCTGTLELFCSFLGNVAGNVALTLGAVGGLYIGGGIVPRLGEAFERSRFRQRFEEKGRFRAYLEAIPTYVVQARTPALIGAARALEELP